MKFLAATAALLSAVQAASWSFSSAKLDISGTPYPFTPTSAPVSASLSPDDKLRVSLTTLEDDTPKRAHQVMLLVKDSHSDLEVNLVVPCKSNGGGSLSLSYADLGLYLTQHASIDLSLIIASFGQTQGLMQHIGTLTLGAAETQQPPTSPVRYAQQPEITHTFRQAQRMPPVSVSLLFSGILAAGFVGLFAAWASVGVNISAAQSALKTAPTSYSIFVASLLAIEISMFLYWTQWRIMQALGTLAVLAVPAFFSGRVALREVQQRRLAGQR